MHDDDGVQTLLEVSHLVESSPRAQSWLTGSRARLRATVGSRPQSSLSIRLLPASLMSALVYLGPPIDDPEILARLPATYAGLLARANGYVAYHGGLHLRGACLAPEWHSLRSAWFGERAVHKLFPVVAADDLPFGEDALGNQFVLRGGIVQRLDTELGEMQSLGVDLADFDAAVRADPVEYLSLQPLERFRAEGGELRPGELLNAYPPYVFRQSAAGVSLRAVSAGDRLEFLAALAASLRDLPDGASISIPKPPPSATV